MIVVRAGDQPTILMGKRAATHRFMPNKFVFPGGRLDAIDQRLQIRGELSDPVMSRLRKATRKDVTDRKLRGLALAAIRETFEETGLVVGRPSSQSVKTAHPVWQQDLGHGVEPPLAQMDFIARAITPPYRTRRFDTRFFLIHDEFIHNDPEQITDASGELNELHWLTLMRLAVSICRQSPGGPSIWWKNASNWRNKSSCDNPPRSCVSRRANLSR